MDDTPDSMKKYGTTAVANILKSDQRGLFTYQVYLLQATGPTKVLIFIGNTYM